MRDFAFDTKMGDGVIKGSVRLPEQDGERFPCVILAGGSKTSPLLSEVSQVLRGHGLATAELDLPQSADLAARSGAIAELTTALFEHMIEPRGKIDIRRLAVFGHKEGASAALDRVARDTRLRALCLSSPEPRSDNSSLKSAAAGMSRPLLILQPEDATREWSHASRELYFSAKASARLKTLAGADPEFGADRQAYLGAVLDFMREVLDGQ